MTTQAENFIDLIVPVAQNVQNRYAVPAAVTIAQAALETGWGRFVVGNNYFGIKATPTTGGMVVKSPTLEFLNGAWVCVDASFCAYKGLSDSANEYGLFLTENARYKPCFAVSNDPLKFTQALQTAGYATDPSYAEKICAIITGYNLVQYDQL